MAVVNTLTWKDTLAIIPFDSKVRPQYVPGSPVFVVVHVYANLCTGRIVDLECAGNGM